jgi:hypothetical protein
MNYLPGLASNCDPHNLSLPSSQDYRCEPPVPSLQMSNIVIPTFHIVGISDQIKLAQYTLIC